jgi:glucose/arabinose dehydrogenase
MIHVQQGGFYGWPYAYIGKHPQPGFAKLAPDKVDATITPDLLFEPHSSVLDLVFYTGDQFPPEYKGSAFVALKGSWNRSEPTGYKVVRVPFRNGQPEGSYENFATGFWASGRQRAEVWGRPAALAVARMVHYSWPTIPAERSGGFPTPARARRPDRPETKATRVSYTVNRHDI